MRYILFGVICLSGPPDGIQALSGFTVKGIVKDQNGVPLANIVIKEKQKNKTTITGADGSFSLKINSDRATLVFTGAGMINWIFLTDQSGLQNINIKSTVSSLNEVVVTRNG